MVLETRKSIFVNQQWLAGASYSVHYDTLLQNVNIFGSIDTLLQNANTITEIIRTSNVLQSMQGQLYI